METERITLSQRERDRLKVLHEVKQKHLSQVAAVERLKVTDRQVRRMLLRIRERGDGALERAHLTTMPVAFLSQLTLVTLRICRSKGVGHINRQNETIPTLNRSVALRTNHGSSNHNQP
jgi:hypothetical protein